MIYNKFQALNLSALGMGCMRLPMREDNSIDVDATRKMVSYAFEKGINYFDTAWGYHGGESETVMGEVLKEYPRDSFYLASKFPGYDLGNMDKVEEIFEAQLKKCQVEYFDFYLFHCVTDSNIDAYLDKDYGICEYLVEQKKKGRIRHLGFSAHSSLSTMKRFMDAYGEHIEFCQLQINWFDWTFQNAKAKVDMMKKYNLPVWVMEPVRGGGLVTVEEKYEQQLKALRPDASVVEWAFRFVQSIPSVTMTLSGMSNQQQIIDNIATYQTSKPLNEEEMTVILNIAKEMTAKKTLPCTACAYCTTYCPKKLNIPAIIKLYNEGVSGDGGFVVPEEINSFEGEKKPCACIGCKACEAVCPQNIRISEMMSDFAGKIK